jgi:hypothetical protein
MRRDRAVGQLHGGDGILLHALQFIGEAQDEIVSRLRNEGYGNRLLWPSLLRRKINQHDARVLAQAVKNDSTAIGG